MRDWFTISWADSPEAIIDPHSAEPEQTEIACGSMPASSIARATPTAETHAPLPPDSSNPTRLLRSDGIGRALKRGKILVCAFCVRSTSGSGSNARRAVRAASMFETNRVPSARTSSSRETCCLRLKGSSESSGEGMVNSHSGAAAALG